jgi:hypothetical protein
VVGNWEIDEITEEFWGKNEPAVTYRDEPEFGKAAHTWSMAVDLNEKAQYSILRSCEAQARRSEV